jgi:membrane-associated protein
MERLRQFIDLFLHLDKHLGDVITQYGAWTYGILFAIVFCETGLVVTPILPGDSLLFAAGALAANDSIKGALDFRILIALLSVAAIAGDAVNYSVGKFLGPKALTRDGRFLKRKYLERTHRFYERHGGKTIILARFVPIVRTFAPFLAGVGEMSYLRFASYNIVGAILWISLFILGGFLFGNIPQVKSNFTFIIMGIVLISVLPIAIELWRSRRGSETNSPPSQGGAGGE